MLASSCMTRLSLGLFFALMLSVSACTPSFLRTTGSGQNQAEPAPVTSAEMDQASTNAWIRELTGLSPAAQAGRAEAVWRDPSQPEMLRNRATFLLATRPSPQSLAAQQALSNTYLSAPRERRAEMERMLTADLLTADAETLKVLAGSVPRVQEAQFPWNLTVWHAAQRNLIADSYTVMTRLSDPSFYADPAIIGLQAVSEPQVVYGTPSLQSGAVALLLPMTGGFSSIANQVAGGAQVAAQVLARQGVQVDLKIIDTENPDWQNQLSALPPEFVVVGGPLRADAYNAVKSSGLTGRALFTFLPLLPNPMEEGVLAWRFFTSPQDQVDAVLDFSMGGLGIHSYGVLAPQDSYGQRMTDIFTQSAAMRGISTTVGSYPGDDMASWTDITRSFVGGVTPAAGKIPVARASFDAIFLPDTWKSMDMLISTLQYHGAHNMVMMGTSLWEQGLANARNVPTATYGLTIFPGVWNAGATTASALALASGMTERGAHTDDWAVLGYDFVQFASSLGLKSAPADAASLNARLGAGIQLDWAGAPMAWDGQGKGHRRLFLFQPSRNGMISLNRDAFSAYRMGTGPLPNAEPEQEVPAGRYEPEALEPALDALVNSITGGNMDAVVPASSAE